MSGPFCELVYGNKQVGVAPGRLFERPNQIEPLDHEGPHDGDHLECLGWEVSLPSVVLTPFAGVRSARRRLLQWASRSPIGVHFQPRF